MSTILFGTTIGNCTIETDLMMTGDEVRTIFSVYRIWKQEALAPTEPARQRATEAVQIVERRLTPPAAVKRVSGAAGFYHPKSPGLMVS